MEGSYRKNRLANTAAEAETGTITHTESLAKNKETGKDEHTQVFERRFPGFKKNLYEYFIEYSSNTTIQGLRYVGEQSRPLFERLAWLIFFCISLYFCISLIFQSYTKWDSSPVLVSFATSPTPVWKIPFPAVTICSQTRAQTSIYNFTENYRRIMNDPGNMTEEEKRHFTDLALVCDNYIYQDGNLTTGNDTIEFLKKAAPEFDEMIWSCRYLDSNETCHDLFTPVLTEEGICYTFNMLDRREVFRDNVILHLEDKKAQPKTKHNNSRTVKGTNWKLVRSQIGNVPPLRKDAKGWTLGGGYKENIPINTYPKRGLAAGVQSRFTLALKSYKQDLDYICKFGVQGFKIMMHNPAEPPRFGLNSYFFIPHLQEVLVATKPDMITTSDSLKNYDPHKRKCYFPEERHLAFYRSYTQANCKQECLTNFTRTKCGCVAFQMPHEEQTPICGSGNIKCMLDAKSELLRKDVESIVDRKQSDVNGYSGCDCLPGCVSLVYNAEISQADLDLKKILRAFKVGNHSDFEGTLVTYLSIFFKEEHFITSERNELYGSTDFLASCGGLLGLFTGFSFLSLVEILYFLSLRLLCNVKRHGRHYWSGSQELINSDQNNKK